MKNKILIEQDELKKIREHWLRITGNPIHENSQNGIMGELSHYFNNSMLLVSGQLNLYVRSFEKGIYTAPNLEQIQKMYDLTELLDMIAHIWQKSLRGW